MVSPAGAFRIGLVICLLGHWWGAAAVRAAKAAGTVSPSRAKAAPVRRTIKVRRSAWVELFHINRREAMRFRLIDDRGRPVNSKGLAPRINRFFRCHHTNQQFRIDARLVRLIYQTARHFPGKRIEIVAGYRSPSVAKNPRSPHMKGLACDFRVAGVPNADLRDYLRRTFKSVGVGYYPNSSFIHLDVRKGASAFWIDYSGPKEAALYSERPADDLRSGRADAFKPSRIDPSWAEEDGPPQSHAEAMTAGGTEPAAPSQARSANNVAADSVP